MSISIAYINPFLTAAKKVCGISMNLPVMLGKPRLAEAGERLWKQYQISAVVHMANAVNGVVLVSFSDRVAIALASRFAGETIGAVNADCRDALGELANNIVGCAKAELPTELVTISTPKIIDTRDFELPAGKPVIILPFESSVGRFIVQVAIESVQEKLAEQLKPAASNAA